MTDTFTNPGNETMNCRSCGRHVSEHGEMVYQRPGTGRRCPELPAAERAALEAGRAAELEAWLAARRTIYPTTNQEG